MINFFIKEFKMNIKTKNVTVFLVIQLFKILSIIGYYFINQKLNWDYHYSIPLLSMIVIVFWIVYDVIYNNANTIDPYGEIFKKKEIKNEVHSWNQD